MRIVIPFRSVMAVGAGVLLFAAVTAIASEVDGETDLSPTLKQQTQAFSEASQAGDVAVLGRYLDRDVVFTSESGDVSDRQEVLDGSRPLPAGAPKRRSEITDWALRRQGENLATATFVDRVSVDVGAQNMVLSFRSTETWVKRADGWKIVASHTMNVPRPPPAITLPPADLAEYVGVYRLASAFTVRIISNGDGLAASVNDGPAVPLLVEVKDVLFTPSAPTARRIFQRDGSGHIIGYISRRDGADLTLKKTG